MFAKHKIQMLDEGEPLQVINLGEWAEVSKEACDTVFLYMDSQGNLYCTSLYEDGIDAKNIRNGMWVFLKTVSAFEIPRKKRAEILRSLWEKWEDERKDYPPFEG
jgi:hypothetical protein